jgi:hypothetical protein
MRLFYIDPGMQNDSGHHASWCRGIVREIRARGIETRIVAYAGIEPTLQAELAALPLFRAFTHQLSDGDPISGWLNWYDTAATVTAEDLAQLTDIGADDLLFVMAGKAPQLKGVLQWLQRLPPERTPTVVFDIGQDPGLEIERDPRGIIYRPRDLREDPTAILYRFTARELPKVDRTRLRLVTMGGASSEAYQALLDFPVGTLPMAHPEAAPLASRVGRRPITVSCLGHQRHEKGFPLIPEIARQLLALHPGIRVLIHNSVPAQTPVAQERLRALAAENDRLLLKEGSVTMRQWTDLLDASDLILCPYQPAKYALRSSGICIEAIAAGIPLVVPAETYLARELRQFGGGGATFQVAEPGQIVRATSVAVANFDEIAALSFAAAARMRAVHGIAPFVDALLATADGRGA